MRGIYGSPYELLNWLNESLINDGGRKLKNLT